MAKKDKGSGGGFEKGFSALERLKTKMEPPKLKDGQESGAKEQKPIPNIQAPLIATTISLGPSSERTSAPLPPEDEGVFSELCSMFGIKSGTKDWHDLRQGMASTYSDTSGNSFIQRFLKDKGLAATTGAIKTFLDASQARNVKLMEAWRAEQAANEKSEQELLDSTPFSEMAQLFDLHEGRTRWHQMRKSIIESFKTRKGCVDLVTRYGEELQMYEKRLRRQGIEGPKVPLERFKAFIAEARGRMSELDAKEHLEALGIGRVTRVNIGSDTKQEYFTRLRSEYNDLDLDAIIQKYGIKGLDDVK